MPPSPPPTPAPLLLTLRSQSPSPSSTTLSLDSTSTVADVKVVIAQTWDGKPKVEGVMLVMGGRVCRDSEVLGEMFPVEEDQTTQEHVLHVIVKPSAWTVPFTAAPPAESTPAPTPLDIPLPPSDLPTPSTTPVPTTTQVSTTTPGYNPAYSTPLPLDDPAHPAAAAIESLRAQLANAPPLPTPMPTATTSTTPSLGPSVSGYPTYLAFVSQLIPLQRSLLLLNLQKAHYFYSIDVQDRLARLGWAESTGSKVDPIVSRQEEESDEGFAEREKKEKERVANEFGEGFGEVKEVKDLLVECGLWGMVKEKEEEAEAEVEVWGPARADPNGEFQVVQIGGLPFMLHVPEGYLAPSHAPPPLALYRSLKRGQAILHILTTMLQLLITYQPTAPSIAYGRALLRGSHATGAAGAGAAAPGLGDVPPRAAGAAAALPGARPRRATLSIVINVEAMLSILLPLFLLSLKLAFLLWIFGRHASPKKKFILFAMAFGWVLWEGWTMHRRRAGAGRDRLERERRRALGLAPVGIPAPPRAPGAPRRGQPAGELRQRGAAVAAAAAANAAAPRGPGAPPPPPPPRAVPRVREPVSRLSPRYWLNWIAAIGLAEEARELGLVPRSIAGRPIVNPHPARPTNPNDRIAIAAAARRRAFRTAIVAVVLFFGTLFPEVEKKRKRALEKRERLLAQRKIARERKATLAAEGEARMEAARVALANASSVVVGAGASTLAEVGEQVGREAGPSTPAGRGVVSDEELFADGVGEPEQAPPEEEGEGEGEGDEAVVEGIESDDDEGRERDGEEPDQVVAMF